MFASFRAELLKLTYRPAVSILVAVHVGAVVLLGYLLLYAFVQQAPGEAFDGGIDGATLLAELRLERMPSQVLSIVVGIGGTLALILGALAVGSEYGWQTIKTVATQRPGRLALMFGRFGALFVVCLVLAVAAFVGGAAGSALVTVLEGLDVTAPPVADWLAAFGAATLVLSLWCALGVALAVLFRGTGWAIGLGLLYGLAIESIIALIPLPGRAGELLEQALISTNANVLVAQFAPPGGDVFTQVPTDVGAGQAVAVLGTYLVVALAVATIVFWRRDIA